MLGSMPTLPRLLSTVPLRSLQRSHNKPCYRQLSSSPPRCFGPSPAQLSARRFFPNPHFTTSEFPEEPLGYSSEIGAGFFQGGPGHAIGPGDRYELQAKLGWGTTSTVWLAKDRHASGEDDQHVTIKILAGYATELNKSSIIFRELEIAKMLASQKAGSGGKHVARIQDHFIEQGLDKDDGEHLCFVTEFYPGDVQSVQYTLSGKPFPVPALKKMLNHLAKGLAEVHEHGIAHTDVKPSTILIRPQSEGWRKGGAIDAWFAKHPPRKSQPLRTPKGMKSSWITQPGPPLLESLENSNYVLSDFSHAEFVEDKEAPEVTIPPLRAPELLVGYPDWDQKVDMWSYGLIAFHLLTNSTIIFPSRLPGSPPGAGIVESMLYQMMCITGEEFPDWLLDWGLQSGAYFHLLDSERRGKLISFDHHEYTGQAIRDILLGEASRAGAVLRKGDLEGASDLLKKCLRLDPKKRASASEIVEHPWLN